MKEEKEKLRIPLIVSTENGNEEKEQVEVGIPKSYLNYNLKPSFRSENKILFYNAQDTKFYERKLENPSQKIWIIRINDFYNYGTKRMMQTAYEMNIQLEWKISTNFDLVTDSKEGTIIFYKGEKIEKDNLPSAIIPRFGSKLDYLAKSALKHFERAGVEIINDWRSLTYASDKFSCYQVWSSKKFPIPKSMLVKFPMEPAFIEKNFSYPFILKKSTSSQGKGIMKINGEEELKDLSELLDESKTLVIQEFIKFSSGRDIRVIVIGGKVIGAMMRIAKTGYKSNFHKGGMVKKVELNDELKSLSIQTAASVGLDICGVDFLIDENGYKICEINASPGFEGFEIATGLNIAKEILEFASKRGKEKKNYVEIESVEVSIMKEHLE
eukprot:gene1522-12648_t